MLKNEIQFETALMLDGYFNGILFQGRKTQI